MGRRLCALALGFIASTGAFSQNLTCTVKSGETLSQIAARYGVSTVALAHANCINNVHKLKLGQTITVPASLHPRTQQIAKQSYVKPIFIGPMGKMLTTALLTSTSKRVSETKSVAENSKNAKRVGKTPAKLVAKSVSYKVVQGDNDWVIARKVSSKPSLIRAANPNVNWSNLKIGMTLNLPNGATKVAKNSIGGTAAIRTRHAIVSKDAVNIRRGPSADSGVVTTVDRGTSVTVLDRESNWYKLRFPRGTVGWIRGDMLKPVSSVRVAQSSHSKNSKRSTTTRTGRGVTVAYNANSGNAAVDRALALLGTRYRWAQANSRGTDCSGLTTQVYKSLGVSLPRRSRDQAQVGAKVAKDELKPGDLVFFHTGRSKRVNHVGIYKGNGQFVHASSSQHQVTVSNLSDGYYSSRFAGARRVKGAKAPKTVEKKHVVQIAAAAEPKSDSASKPVGEHKDANDSGIK